MDQSGGVEASASVETIEDPPTKPFGMARRTIGICFLLGVVVLWTASNFLASVRVVGQERSYDVVSVHLSLLYIKTNCRNRRQSLPTIPIQNPSSLLMSTLQFLCFRLFLISHEGSTGSGERGA